VRTAPAAATPDPWVRVIPAAL